MEEKYIKSFDNSEIFYRVWTGKRDCLVFLHGVTASLQSWMFIAPFFIEKGYMVIEIDLRGHGGSSRGETLDFYKVDNNVSDVAAVLDNKNVHEAVFIGHSLGAGIAQKFYQAFPARVKAMVLISAKFVEIRPTVIVKILNGILRIILSLSSMGQPNRNYPDYRKYQNTMDIHAPRILADIKVASLKTYAASILTGNNFENKNYLAINVPTLIIHGRKDLIAPYGAMEKAAAEKENFHFQALSTNHITLLNKPEEINESILKFFVKL